MFLGIEIGGTKLQFGVGAGDGGDFAAFVRRDVQREDGAAGILRQIAEVATRLANDHAITAVGIGFGGPVDAAAGRVIKSHQVAGWENQPLASWCRDLLQAPVVLGNDCDSAALAEARFGAGQSGRTVLFVTVGTGIGGGLVIDRRLHGQGRPAVAEIGHLRPGLEAASSEQTVESLAAGPGIAASARRRIDASQGSLAERQDLLRRCGQDFARLTAQAVAEAASDGNALAAQTLAGAIRVLGWAIAQAITLTAADVVVVGGGVSLMGEISFFVPLRAEVERYVFPPLLGAYRIVPAGLGEAVVVHGALALASE